MSQSWQIIIVEIVQLSFTKLLSEIFSQTYNELLSLKILEKGRNTSDLIKIFKNYSGGRRFISYQ